MGLMWWKGLGEFLKMGRSVRCFRDVKTKLKWKHDLGL